MNNVIVSSRGYRTSRGRVKDWRDHLHSGACPPAITKLESCIPPTRNQSGECLPMGPQIFEDLGEWPSGAAKFKAPSRWIFWITNFSLPFAYQFARLINQPIYILYSISLCFLLIALLQLNERARLVRWTKWEWISIGATPPEASMVCPVSGSKYVSGF